MHTCNKLRQSFLDYFAAQDHEVVPSSSLVPSNDSTLLFTNAGMVQFKDVFLGHETRQNPRAATVQKCVRAGGKHNDLENVGYTARHHTFFEMLGNFSFGDYFKEEAIHYAWDYLTKTLSLPPNRLWISVYQDDNEAEEIWQKHISSHQISRCGEDNFWSMGNTGPCGPCSEIFYDHGEAHSGTPPGEGDNTDTGERYIEIWNLVFTQYNRDANGELCPIPKPSVDTGMGLERIAAVMQGVHNNYDIDTFKRLITAVNDFAPDAELVASRVIADHIRAATFLISDGVTPGNEGRNYVLRRIIRRAARYGHKIGLVEPFFYRLVGALTEEMGDSYHELCNQRENIEVILLNEEKQFNQTLSKGLHLLQEIMTKLSGNTIPGEQAFMLYDTYGFPIDLTADIAKENGLAIDEAGFNRAMEQQRKLAAAANRFALNLPTVDGLTNTFSGYERLNQKSKVIGLYQDGKSVTELNPNEAGGVILMDTPFYAEAGGQIGDCGKITNSETDETVYFEVEDTKRQGTLHIHIGTLQKGTLAVADPVAAHVDGMRRESITRNHSATHLLHAALRYQLGTHIVQKGSWVGVEGLRFDFSCEHPLDIETLNELECTVNEQIVANVATKIEEMPLEQAKQSGSCSLFGEKYSEIVRVLSIGGDFSKELCGGTHVARTGDIGFFKIISETGVAAGIRRIEAVTGGEAVAWAQHTNKKFSRIAELLKTDKDHAEIQLSRQLERLKQLDKQNKQLNQQLAGVTGMRMIEEAVTVGHIKVVAQQITGATEKSLRHTIDQLKQNLKETAIVLATIADTSKVIVVAGVSKNCTDKIKAEDLVNFVTKQIGGKGGGRAEFAQGGGNQPEQLAPALTKVPNWIQEQLSGD